MQALTMFQPEAILNTGVGGIVSVEMGPQATVVRLHDDSKSAHPWTIPPTAYLSDEADKHYALLRIDNDEVDEVLTFEALPATTRVFDLIGDSLHRWLGVHSGVRAMRFAEVHPRYDDHATITDSIADFLHVVSLEGLLADDSLYASVKAHLPLYRNYVVWKWKLTPHEAFLLRRMQERTPQSASSGQANTPSQRSVISLPTQLSTQVSRPKRGNFFQRLFGRSKKKEDTTPPASAATQQKPRPLSRFEQKMLQESRTKK